MIKQGSAIIRQQLGGMGKLKAMLGVKETYYDGEREYPNLIFKFKGSRKLNLVDIELNGKDLYNMKFFKNGELKKEVTDLYNDQLVEIFESETGLYLSLF